MLMDQHQQVKHDLQALTRRQACSNVGTKAIVDLEDDQESGFLKFTDPIAGKALSGISLSSKYYGFALLAGQITGMSL